MLGHTLVILSDAHIGAASADVEEALLAFLDAVPSLGDALLINGDLFQFWFAYRHVLPRRAFGVAARIDALARKVPIAIVGGNHDRWGDTFWAGRPGVTFGRQELRFEVGTRRVLAVHGDGLATSGVVRPLVQRVVGHRVTSAAYRLLHPDLAVPLVGRVSPLIGGTPDTPERRAVKAARQRAWAEAYLDRAPSVDALIMGHTHAPALVEPSSRRLYINPGAWIDGLRFAVLSGEGAELRAFDRSG